MRPEPTSATPDRFTQILEAVRHIQQVCSLTPRVGIVLGSGLGEFATQVEESRTLSFAEIPNFPRPTVEGHSGKLVLGTIGDVPVAVMQGRVHAYEGCSLDEVAFPTRVLGLLGAHTLILTNAAGGINPDCTPGTLVAISDHINFTGTNPLAGPNEPRFSIAEGAGQRFFDMSSAYSPALRRLAQQEARKQGYALPEGVYLAVLGPSFETPAEIRAFRTLGADLVGMSTVHEVIAARHMGMEVLGLSLVTNAAAGFSSEPIQHDDVMIQGRRAAARLGALLCGLLPHI